MTTKTCWLADRGVIRVEGEDAASLLQGLLTNDVETLAPAEARYAALLTPQGKILVDMLVVRGPADGNVFLLDCSAAQAADLAKRLGFYKLRAKAQITNASDTLGVVASWGAEPTPNPDALAYPDPRDPRLGRRFVLPLGAAAAFGESELPAYEALRISLGVPKGGLDFAYGDAFPHDANLDLLNGVDFQKGCFVGQEVVSRMKHRGTARKRVARVVLAGEPPPPGTPVLDGALLVGALGSAAGREALALLRLDRVEEAKAAARGLDAAGISVSLVD